MPNSTDESDCAGDKGTPAGLVKASVLLPDQVSETEERG